MPVFSLNWFWAADLTGLVKVPAAVDVGEEAAQPQLLSDVVVIWTSVWVCLSPEHDGIENPAHLLLLLHS